MKSLSKSEIESLLKKCLLSKNSGKSLSNVFEEFAKEKNMSAGSVRNLYYKIVGGKEKFFNDIGVPEKLKPAFIKEFNESETRFLIKKILTEKSKGKSVRQTVLNLASGNSSLALRYQNKYRNALIFNKNIVLEIVNEIKKENGDCYNPYINRKSKSYKFLEKSVDNFIDKIYRSFEKTKTELVDKINLLQQENIELKKALSGSNVEDYFKKKNDYLKRIL